MRTGDCSCEIASCCAQTRTDGVSTVLAARNWKNSRRLAFMPPEISKKIAKPKCQTPNPNFQVGISWDLEFGIWDLGFTSESRRQIELKHPAAARTLERTREVELSDRVSEQVDTECRSGGRHALPAA